MMRKRSNTLRKLRIRSFGLLVLCAPARTWQLQFCFPHAVPSTWTIVIYHSPHRYWQPVTSALCLPFSRWAWPCQRATRWFSSLSLGVTSHLEGFLPVAVFPMEGYGAPPLSARCTLLKPCHSVFTNAPFWTWSHFHLGQPSENFLAAKMLPVHWIRRISERILMFKL